MNQQRILIGTTELSLMERTFNSKPYPIEEIVECENGSETQYYVGVKNIFDITFNMLPAADANVEDSKAGRNSLKALYDLHAFTTLTLYSETGVATTSNVRFTSYGEEANRPMAGDTDWRYNISFSLKEV
jgi:hypothetical protein